MKEPEYFLLRPEIEKVYGYSHAVKIGNDIFTTNMPLFLEHAAYRNSIYTNHFPTGSWLGVKELALPEFMTEIELEVYKV